MKAISLIAILEKRYKTFNLYFEDNTWMCEVTQDGVGTLIESGPQIDLITALEKVVKMGKVKRKVI